MIKWHYSYEIPKCDDRVIILMRHRLRIDFPQIFIACWEECDCYESYCDGTGFVPQCSIFDSRQTTWSSCEKEAKCINRIDIIGWIPLIELADNIDLTPGE